MNFWNEHFHPHKITECSELQPVLGATLMKIYQLWQAAGFPLLLLLCARKAS